jgi:hypothetical protein
VLLTRRAVVARSCIVAKNAGDWLMKSPSLVRALMASHCGALRLGRPNDRTDPKVALRKMVGSGRQTPFVSPGF